MTLKNITIRGIDPALDRVMKAAARAGAVSVNQLVIDTLKAQFGLAKAPVHARQHHDLDALFGCWSAEHYETVQGAIDAQRRIDPELWQ